MSLLVSCSRLRLHQSQGSSVLCSRARSSSAWCSHLSLCGCFWHPPGCSSTTTPGQFLDSVGFYSKKLSDAEKKYSPFDHELLAAYSFLRHFRFMLEGREFTLFTDHKPLTHALFRVSLPWSARQQRHLSYLAEFTSSIFQVPGPENVGADTLSRPSSVPSPSTSALVSLSFTYSSTLKIVFSA